jgi:hypothetical protein
MLSRLHDAECGPSAVPRQGEAGVGQQALEHGNGRCGVAFLALDKLVASYPVVLDILNAAISEQDFIKLARNSMREDGYTAEDIAEAKFGVRGVPE